MGSLSESADVKFVQFAQKYTTLQEAFNEEERFNRTLATSLGYLEMEIDLILAKPLQWCRMMRQTFFGVAVGVCPMCSRPASYFFAT